ncbi:hypothetical protein PGH12_12385 [Chryseobacterium wangxinyae]|uniref:hypothetical protein n=1 Tax=Chryseobacterium sp. CY350 TaxID=2997336 RepID=UPI0022703970|nr:hypothetical protein [Chryseobacterium sp. CY350]MCY0976133.1 hypothetical protein [Chryseobacterium sp. CY350]WBZ94267.1 hypothetical protein PGH12_12385 [Chryseobacterium sp. CY350]
MKKIIIASFVTLSTFVFAKAETQKEKNEKNTEQKVLVVKKTIDENQKKVTIQVLNTARKQKELSDADLCIIELALGPVIAGPPYHCAKASQSTN